MCCLLPRLASRGWSPVLFVSQDHAAPYMDLPGVQTVPLKVRSHPAPVRSAMGIPLMMQHCRRLGCTVFLTETPPPPPDMPFVLTIHDMRAWEAPTYMKWGRRWWTKRTIPKAVQQARAILTPSTFTAEAVNKRFDSANVVVARNGCDHFPLDHPQKRENFLLAVGPWNSRKDLKTILTAHARLQAQIKLVLVGEPSARIPQPDVEVIQPDDVRLATLYRSACLTVCASRYEGFNLPLAEAMAQGCPVVASDIPVHREVAADCARYYEAGNPTALAQAIHTARSAPVASKQLLERANGLSWRQCALDVDAVLRKVARG